MLLSYTANNSNSTYLDIRSEDFYFMIGTMYFLLNMHAQEILIMIEQIKIFITKSPSICLIQYFQSYM